jgi:putative DNA primase/helicase
MPSTSSKQIDITLQDILTKTKAKPNPGGKGWTGHCPSHKDKTPSLSIDQAADGTILLNCFANCDNKTVCADLNITQADLFPPKQTQAQGKPKYNIDKTYYYKDESGTFLFQAVRLRLADPIKWPNEPKKAFKQRQPDGNGGWIWNLKGVRRVLYGLPDLIAADPDATVWIVEGEKDRDRLKSLGLVSTCNPMGAGKWRDEYSDFLAGRDCVVIEDNDDPGRAHAEEVCQSLSGKARSLRKLSFPDLPEHSDVSDWLDAGHDETELCQMADALPEWTPAQAQQASTPDPDEWEKPAPFFEFDLPEFPVDALSSWKRSFVERLAIATQTPVDLGGNLSLTVCGAAVARNVRIEARKGWQEPLNIYDLIALKSANRKSAVFEEITRPLFDYEQTLILEKRDEIADAASEYRMLEAERAELEKRAAKADPTDRDPNKRPDALKQEAKAKARELAARKMPALPKRIIDDATPEVMATILAEQDGRIAIFSPEGGLFETIAGRYTNGTPNIDVLLKGHSGDDLRVDRRDRSEHIKRPALTIGLAVQPDVLRGLIDKPGFKGRGLLGRFLYSIPDSTVGRRKIKPDPVPDEARQTYSQNIKRLAKIEPNINTDGETEPQLIRLSKDADDYLAKFEEEIEPMLGPDGDLHSIADWGGKLAGATVRLAGILHLAEHADSFNLNGKWPHEVSADTFKKAVKIARYLIPHARAAYAEMGADPKIEDAKYILRWIEKSGLTEFTKREAFEGTKGRFKQVVAMEPALKALEDHGYIRLEDTSAPSRPGRRPSQKFLVNPLMSRP